MEFKESRRPNQSRNSRVNYVIRQQKPITFSQLTAQEKQKMADYTASSSNAQSIIYNHLNSYSLNVENKDSLARNFAYNSYAQDISMSYMRVDDNFGSYFDSYLGVEKGFKRMMSAYMSYVPDVQKTLNSYAYFDGFGSYWASLESDNNIVQRIAYFTSNDEDSQVTITKALKVENLTDDFKSNTAYFVSKDEPAVNRIYSGIRLSKIDAEFKTEIDKVASYSGDKAGTKSGAIAGDAAGERVANLRYDEAYGNGHTAGYNSGKTDGYNSGHSDGYSEGFKAGVDSVKPAEPEAPIT